jgi:transposase-like protein
MKTNSTEGSEIGSLFQGESWFDPLEAGPRGRIRAFIEAMPHEDLTAILDRGRYERAAGKGVRNGTRERQLLGWFGPVTASVPRARLTQADGTTQV